AHPHRPGRRIFRHLRPRPVCPVNRLHGGTPPGAGGGRPGLGRGNGPHGRSAVALNPVTPTAWGWPGRHLSSAFPTVAALEGNRPLLPGGSSRPIASRLFMTAKPYRCYACRAVAAHESNCRRSPRNESVPRVFESG